MVKYISKSYQEVSIGVVFQNMKPFHYMLQFCYNKDLVSPKWSSQGLLA